MRKKEELDLYIDKTVMDRVKYKRKINPETNEDYYEGTYKLSFFYRDNLTDEEIEYVFHELNHRQILVVGNSSVLYSDFENYRYVRRPMNRFQKEEFDEEKFNELIFKFKTMKQETEEEQEEAILLRKKIISMNTRLVDFMVDRFNTNNEFDSDELASYAYEGLISAVDNYDLDKGSFANFTLKCIEGYLIRGRQYLKGFSSSNFFYKYKDSKQILEEELGRKIEDDLEYVDDIATQIHSTYKLHLDTVDDIKTRIFLMNLYSLETMEDELYDDNTLYNDVIESLNRESLKEELDKCLSKLTPREKEIMIEKWGLKDGIYKSNREVAKIVGCKHQNIAEMERRSLYKLRNGLATKKLEDYYTNMGEYDYSPTGIEFSTEKQKVKLV